jgi:hypothetical protein
MTKKKKSLALTEMSGKALKYLKMKANVKTLTGIPERWRF